MLVDHIAVLTADLHRQSDALPSFCHKEASESFPAEGTQEQYVEFAEQTPKLLLLQPIAPGPYAKALAKRGPGLHHIGVKAPSIEALVPRMREHGLLLHPISIQTIKRGVVWLCRPGMPFLIELMELYEGEVCDNIGAFDLGLPKGSPVPDFAAQLFPNMRMYEASTNCLELQAGERQVRLPLM